MAVGNDCSIGCACREAHAFLKNNCIKNKQSLEPVLKTACALLIIMMIGSVIGQLYACTSYTTMSACLGAGSCLFAFIYYCLSIIRRHDKDISLLSKEALKTGVYDIAEMD